MSPFLMMKHSHGYLVYVPKEELNSKIIACQGKYRLEKNKTHLMKNLDGKIYEATSSAKKWSIASVLPAFPVPLSKKTIGKSWPLIDLYVPSHY